MPDDMSFLPDHIRPARIASALIAFAAVALLAAAPAEGAVKFKIKGHGYGHGIGMSQWGAYGYAKQGASHKKILRHYYKGTKLGKAGKRPINVLLGTRSGSVAFSGAKRACGRSLKPSKTYRADPRGGKIRLEKASGKKLAGCGDRLGAQSRKKIKIGGEGTYRGSLVVKVSGGGVNVINSLGLDNYVKGVVPNEVPASWPAAALRSQAVAARSYALATDVNGDGFDAYDDIRSQVYGGLSSEQPSTNKAVDDTERQVVKHNGEVIPAFFFSSSGGRTENIENAWPGSSPRPYLKSVRDPYDKGSPYHNWKLTLSRSQMENALSGLFSGKLKRVEVLDRGVSPRIVRARVVGSKGSASISGPDLRSRLGLRSTWAKIKRIKR